MQYYGTVTNVTPAAYWLLDYTAYISIAVDIFVGDVAAIFSVSRLTLSTLSKSAILDLRPESLYDVM